MNNKLVNRYGDFVLFCFYNYINYIKFKFSMIYVFMFIFLLYIVIEDRF